MRSLERMKAALSPTGLYSLDGGTLVFAEISAYALAIECLETEIDELKREMFVSSAESFGLDHFERLLSLPAIANASVQERRERINKLTSKQLGEWNGAVFSKGLFALLPPNYSLSNQIGKAEVEIGKVASKVSDFKDAISYLLDYFPAYIRFISAHTTPVWQEIDESGLNWGYADSLALPWCIFRDQTT